MGWWGCQVWHIHTHTHTLVHLHLFQNYKKRSCNNDKRSHNYKISYNSSAISICFHKQDHRDTYKLEMTNFFIFIFLRRHLPYGYVWLCTCFVIHHDRRCEMWVGTACSLRSLTACYPKLKAVGPGSNVIKLPPSKTRTLPNICLRSAHPSREWVVLVQSKILVQ